ncbi:ABC transporter substrate-binding protein [Pseudothermotoga lettingae]|uniref:Extracellular solute-binding protein family 5 n=1 Tax=Pseudothermotoga lettingae (strain ATCC BAA-301 / DSM 14385 / NBRC 107922 / TMO) TaxID=416591 RepID=A8F434_PSELT|nr:ABC transporter substrate-binding protein [Pseudothermotoga lettingae]ABV32918.1 extracellular solute-binding protein family 5 [Pseudothermotoga lettingae TMO]GLI48083.1 peptide ABC transporter substrate-binding protein [Pseudothermotoga lettingae TMO]
MKKLFWLMLLLISVNLIFAQLAADVPRDETFIANQLTGRVGTPGNFNLWAGWRSQDRGIQNLLLEPLWCVEYATGEIINALAAEPPIYSEDFTELTIKLRKGVYWSDGVPFTADDVVYTIELVKKTSGMDYNSQMQAVLETKKIDDYTVLVKLNSPNSRFHTYFLDRWGALRPLPKHIFEKVADPMTFEFNPPVGTGPYILKNYDAGGYWTLWERREDWDRTPTGMLYGKPVPKFVLIQTFGPAERQVLAMAQHQLDAADLTMEALKAVLSRVDTARAWRREFPWTVNIDPCVTGVMFNTAKAPFDNPDVRWALTLSIDIVEYAANAFDGAVTLSPIHVPLTSAYYDWYYTKLDGWLKNLEIDIGNGEKFKPYDPDAGKRLAEYVKQRGYSVPTNPEEVKKIFGPGWYKYAPDVAEKLLLKNGFKKDKSGKWLLPDGKPWQIVVITNTNPAHPSYRNAFAVAQAWKKFGIDATVMTTDALATLGQKGDFDVTSDWPAAEPWGGHPDLYRVLDPFNSEYLAPIGENAPWGNYGRWSSSKMDEVIEKLRNTDWNDTETIVDVGVEGLKLLIQDMPSIPTFNYPGVIAWDEYYWTNYPGAENMYAQPYHHWPNLKYMLPFLKPTGRK